MGKPKHIRNHLFKALISFFRDMPVRELINPFKAVRDDIDLISTKQQDREFVGQLIQRMYIDGTLEWPESINGEFKPFSDLNYAELNAFRTWIFNSKYFWQDPILRAWYDVLTQEADLRALIGHPK